jgi:signal transduction histidine kinase
MEQDRGWREEHRQRGISFFIGWLSNQPVRSPIATIDRHLLLARWGIILAVGIPSILRGFQGVSPVPPFAVTLIIGAYNLPVSLYIWYRRPLARGRSGWLILGDLAQATLAVVLTGGYRSYFSLLFLLPITEIALSFAWRTALIFILIVSVLQVPLGSFRQPQTADPLAGFIVVSEFTLSLATGGVLILLSEVVRGAQSARQRAVYAAARTATLNRLFLRLGESALDLDRTLATLLDSMRTLAEVAFGLVLLPAAENGTWEVAASTSEHHMVGELIGELDTDGENQVILMTGEGTERPLPAFVREDDVNQLVGVYLPAPTGHPVGVLAVGRRTTARLRDSERAFLQSLALEAGLVLRNVRLYEQERKHVDRLQEFEQLRSVFFSAISHELKTPLTVMKTLMPALRQWHDLPAHTRSEIVETLEQNLVRLEMLINDLLESARLEGGAVMLHPRSLNLAPLVRRALEDLEPLFDRKQQVLDLSIADALPRVWADARRVRQILSNLINNAVKFSPPETAIRISLDSVPDGVRVCVADSGPGVAPEDRDRIFEKFYIATRNEAYSGAGLGLFICRELVQLHGGRIWVESNAGAGSRFCFTLPLAKKEDRLEEGSGKDIDH